MRVLTRKAEAAIGGRLLRFISRKLLKQAAMVPKEVVLEDGLTVYYYEREGSCSSGSGVKLNDTTSTTKPTLLLLHGMTDEAKNLAPIVARLRKEFPHWRMIVPDLIGHGRDLERVKQVGVDNFDYPTPMRLLETMKGLLKALQIQECSVMGISLGGALAYYLQHAKPEVVQKTVLINPAMEHVVNKAFIEDFVSRRKNHFCVESRQDCKELFRDLSCNHRRKKNPVPKFFLEAFWRDHKSRVPPRHFRTYFTKLLDERGKDPEGLDLGSTTDISPHSRRLVIWPHDDHIANYDKGKEYFETSSNTTFHSIPDCGHWFHSNGQTIMELAAPIIMTFLHEGKEERAP